MTLVIKKSNGETIEYANADHSRMVIEWVENYRRQTAIYGTCDFVVVSVKGKEPEEANNEK